MQAHPSGSVLSPPPNADTAQSWNSHTHQPIGSRRPRYQTHSGIPESQISDEFVSSPLANLLPGLGQHPNISRVQSAPAPPASAVAHVSACTCTCNWWLFSITKVGENKRELLLMKINTEFFVQCICSEKHLITAHDKMLVGEKIRLWPKV